MNKITQYSGTGAMVLTILIAMVVSVFDFSSNASVIMMLLPSSLYGLMSILNNAIQRHKETSDKLNKENE